MTVLTEMQQNGAFGLLLGDAQLQSQNNKNTYGLPYEQGDCHKQYIHHIVHLFDPWFGVAPKKIIRNKNSGKQVLTWRCQTKTHPEIQNLADFMYQGNPQQKKLNPNFINQHFTPRGLAYWFMDDSGKSYYGLKRRNGIVFNTDSLDVTEVTKLISGLHNKFKLNCWIKTNKSRPIIVVSGYSYKIFLSICGKFIHRSMYCKLPCGGEDILKVNQI